MTRKWMTEEIISIVRGFQPACLLLAAADLNVFSILKTKPMSAKEVSDKLEADIRAVTILLDALAAMEFLTKQNKEYGVSSEAAQLLTEDSSKSILPAIRFQANCLRRWVQLPQVIRNGQPVPSDYLRPRPDVPVKSEQEARPMKCPDEIGVMGKYPS